MFDFSFAEIAFIVIVAVIFIGPNELPVVIKATAKVIRGLRSLTKELKQAFEELSRESGLHDIANDITKEVHQQTRMIKGDDGKLYEAYDLPTPLIPKLTPEVAPKPTNDEPKSS